MRYCYNCERKCKDEDNYCSNCGAKLEYEQLTPLDFPSTNSRLSPTQPLEVPRYAVQSAQGKRSSRHADKTKPKKRRAGIFIKFLRLITSLLVILGAFYVFVKMNPEGWLFRSGILIQQDIHNDPIFWILGLVLAAVIGIVFYVFSFIPRILKRVP